MGFLTWLKKALTPSMRDDNFKMADTPNSSTLKIKPEEAIVNLIASSLFQEDTETMKESIEEYAKENGLTESDIVFAAKKSTLSIAQRMLEDGVIDEHEEALLGKLCSMYNIGWDDFDHEAQTLFSKGRLVRDLVEGNIHPRIVVSDNPFKLQKTEILIWLWSGVPMSTVKTKSKIEGRTQGVSFRVMKGVYFRTGGFSGERVSRQEVETLGNAIVAVTSKHIYYIVGHESKRIPHDKVITIRPYSDAVVVTLDGARAYPLAFHVDDPWYFANIVQNAQNWNISPEEAKRINEEKARQDIRKEKEVAASESVDEEEVVDRLYPDVVQFCREQGKASISLVQRRFKIGFSASARIVEKMEEEGIIGPANDEGPRNIF